MRPKRATIVAWAICIPITILEIYGLVRAKKMETQSLVMTLVTFALVFVIFFFLIQRRGGEKVEKDERTIRIANRPFRHYDDHGHILIPGACDPEQEGRRRMIAFIGYGHMGSVLLNGFLAGGAIEPSRICISTKTISKLDALSEKYPEMHVADGNREAVKMADLVFLCVGTYQVKSVLEEIQGSLRPDCHLVFMSGGLEIRSFESLYKGPVTKIIPTLLAEVREGLTLVCHNACVTQIAKERLEALLGRIGGVKAIAERQFETGADFTSCAPGLLAAMCDLFVKAGIAHGDFTYEEAQGMLVDSLYGTAKLLKERGEGFLALIGRVATTGGATEGGVQVMKERLPDAFAEMFSAMMQRHDKRKLATREQFS